MLAAVVAMQAVMLTPGFRPPLDAPIRIIFERVESLPAERRYRLETAARFARVSDGFRAEVRIVSNGARSPVALASLVEHGFAALAGRTIVMHFDRQGHLNAIDDLDGLWERFCQAVAENAARRPSLTPEQAATLSARIVAPLRAYPAQKRRDMLGGLVTPALATEPVEPVGTSRTVQVPGASPFGGAVTLQGTRSTKAAGPGVVEASILAEADVEIAAEGAAPARTGHVALERRQSFDPHTGMALRSIESRRTTTGLGPDARTVLLFTTTQVLHNMTWPE